MSEKADYISAQGFARARGINPPCAASADNRPVRRRRCPVVRGSTQTGYPILAGGGALSEELRRFLAAGPPPVYAGFGSMPYGGRDRVGQLLVKAAERAGQRIVIYRGWARIPGVRQSEACLLVDEEPHGLLFPSVRAVIHHGGAGTVATAARAGIPQIVLPQAATSSWGEARFSDSVSGLGRRCSASPRWRPSPGRSRRP